MASPSAPPSGIFGSTSQTSRRVGRWLRQGIIRKIGPRLYTSDLVTPAATLIQEHLWDTVAHVAPMAVVGHRTSLLGAMSEETVYVTAPYARRMTLPGLTVVFVPGPGPLAGDRPFVNGLFYASTARAILENLMPSRQVAGTRRALPADELWARLSEMAMTGGVEWGNEVSQLMREIAEPLGATAQLAMAVRLVERAVTQRSATPSAPDRDALSRLDRLFAGVQATQVLPPTSPLPTETGAFSTLGLWDAFWNARGAGYTLSLSRARELAAGAAAADTAEEVLLALLQVMTHPWTYAALAPTITDQEHAVDAIFRAAGRLLTSPHGARATHPRTVITSGVGTTPGDIVSTLRDGWVRVTAAETALGRATLAMALITDVRPLAIGNGRLARVLANALLVQANERPILWGPTLLTSLHEALVDYTTTANPIKVIRTMEHAQQRSSLLHPETLSTVRHEHAIVELLA
jgi:hypothetical protein